MDANPVPKNRPKGTYRLAKIHALIDSEGPFCFYCEHELLDPRKGSFPLSQWWPTLDHLMPRVLGGTNRSENLVLSCRQCNGLKGGGIKLLVDVILRLRRQKIAIQENLDRAEGFIDHLQWELHDAGLGEMPGRVELVSHKKRKKSWRRPRGVLRDPALFIELGERVCANLRGENHSSSPGRISCILKRGRKTITLDLAE